MGGSEIDPDDDVSSPGLAWRETPLWARCCAVLPFLIVGAGIVLCVLE